MRTLLSVLLLATSAFASQPPNILLIMADDMGWSDIGCYGGEVHTPNIDRLAAEGMQFTQFYNNAKCTTTRASLLTGLYPRNGGQGQEQLLTKNMITLGEGLRLAGYSTGMSGKWHNGSKPGTLPYDRGFEEAYGLWDGCCNFFNPNQPDPKFKGGKVRPFGHNDERITEFPDDFYTTDAFTDHAIDTIRRHAKSGRPFFHYLPYTAPHYPLHAKPEDIAKYKGRFAEGWDVLRENRLKKQIAMGLVKPEWAVPQRDKEAKPWDEDKNIDPEWQNLRMETYAAMIDCMDQNIGRLLDTLDDLGVAENTLILFLSDNGGCAETPGGNDPKQVPGPAQFYSHVGPGWAWLQNTPWRRYKSHCHEGGISTPLLARWPATIEPGSRTDAVGHIIDFLPTFLDVAGAEYPKNHADHDLIPVEGHSLRPLFEDRPSERLAHDTLFWNWSGTRAMRQGDWKIAWDKGSKAWELYHIPTDRTETRDVANEQPDRVAAMAEKWNAWAKMTGVKVKK